MNSKARVTSTLVVALAIAATTAGLWAKASAAADPTAVADLTVAPGIVEAGAATLAVGRIDNVGTSALTQVTATFTLPAGATFREPGGTAPASDAGCTASGQTVTCAVPSPIAAGDSRKVHVVFDAPSVPGTKTVLLSFSVKEQSSSGSSQRPPTTVNAPDRTFEVVAEDAHQVDARCTTGTQVATSPGVGEVATTAVLQTTLVGTLPCNPLVARDRPKNEVTVCTNGAVTCTGEVAFIILPTTADVTVVRYVPPGFPLVHPRDLVVWEVASETAETAYQIPFCPLDEQGSPVPLPLTADTDSCKTSVTRSGRTYTITLLVNGTGVDPGIAG